MKNTVADFLDHAVDPNKHRLVSERQQLSLVNHASRFIILTVCVITQLDVLHEIISTYIGLDRFQLTGARLIASATSWRRLNNRHVVTMTTVNTDVIDRDIIATIIITAAAADRCMTSHADDVTGRNMLTLSVTDDDRHEWVVVELWLAERGAELTVTAEWLYEFMAVV